MTSPSHESTQITHGPSAATARVHQTDGAPLTKDWRLHVALDRAYESSARVQATETQSVAMLSFYPDLEDNEVYSEIIFLVDRSGSMAGEKMRRGTGSIVLIFSIGP
jgi:Mg-chelatase subunit ChlD